ncbi:MAG TPA: hypothetical protein P5160_05695 [Candidatus Omnitrophota bacterium]|nr:hypothetical protein [Candidatus Omnitrophota bacterium]
MRRLVAQGEAEQAVLVFKRASSGYGRNHELLFFLDRGMVNHYAGRYTESIQDFEHAKGLYETLFTQSISKKALTWIWNDYAQPYRGEDFERAMLNLFQAMNFVALGKIDEALVEARNVDLILRRFNQQYGEQANVYKDDAFVRFLMGILYESTGRSYDVNDAFVSYRTALEIYEGDYATFYDLKAPLLLKENLLSVSQWMGTSDLKQYQSVLSDVSVKSMAERGDSAQVYVILYRRMIANKVQSTIFLPGIDGYLTRISFPKYRNVFQSSKEMVLEAKNVQGEVFRSEFQQAEDLNVIAKKNLEDRRLRIAAKAVVRPVAKQLVFEKIEDKIHEKAGDTAGELVRYAGMAYVAFSEEADTRSWETLPAEIRVARLILDAGTYEFFVEGERIGSLAVMPGDQRFLTHWTMK